MDEDMTSAACLRIAGDDLLPDEISRILGCVPSYSTSKGQVSYGKATGRQHVAGRGCWHLEAGRRAPADLDGQIMEIIGRVNQDPDAWVHLSNRFRVDMFCALFMGKGSEGLSLTPEALLALGTRRIKLGLCLYGPETDESIDESQ